VPDGGHSSTGDGRGDVPNRKSAPEMRRVFGTYLVELGALDDRVIVLDNDSDTTTDTVQFHKRFPERFLEMGIAEKNIFGTAAGLAAVGFVPFPTIFATMATRCALDQVTISICYPGLNVKIPGHYVGGSKAGASHIPLEDIAVMRALPNMRVADPADADELMQAMRLALDTDGPVYFRVSKLAHPPIPQGAEPFSWGRGRVVRGGSDVTIFSTGMMPAVALHAADLLSEEAISSLVVHLPSIKPLDTELVAESAAATGAAVTVENASTIGGLGSAVAETLAETFPVPMERVGLSDQWIHSGSVEQIFARHGLRAPDIVRAAKTALDRRDKGAAVPRWN
jgi:transketolase